jgi:succinate-semialdehyde dehydrogenase/glutarate-semialdehyde dehydrogenase
MAGNTAVKTCFKCQGCALHSKMLLERISEGTFTNLNIESKQVTDVIEDKNIVAVTLTGSEPAGVRSSLIAGQNLKKTVMS